MDNSLNLRFSSDSFSLESTGGGEKTGEISSKDAKKDALFIYYFFKILTGIADDFSKNGD